MPKPTLPIGREKRRLLVSDTSALMSLSIGDLLNPTTKIAQILIPHKVQEELELHASFSIDAANALGLIKKGQIVVVGVRDKVKARRLAAQETAIDVGEAEVVVLAEEQGADLIITDDFRALRAMRRVSTAKIHMSIYVAAALVITGVLSLNEAMDRFATIAKGRNWRTAEVYEHARAYLDALK